MRKPILLFDLGGTLVEYYRRSDFPPILREAIDRVAETVAAAGLSVPDAGEIMRRVDADDREARNHGVRPLEARLERIFGLSREEKYRLAADMCRAFFAPIFARGRLFDDTIEFLDWCRQRDYRVGIVSNCPWGSPGWLWREELERHGLHERCERAVFCTDVGWRKPALPIFRAVLDQFACRAEDCMFVGDDPRWDVRGARRAGMFPVLIDRTGESVAGIDAPVIDRLHGLESILEHRGP